MFIAGERTEDVFTAPGAFERLVYGFSIFHCLPEGMGWRARAGDGYMIRRTVRRYAEADFSTCEVLPIEDDFWRFHLLQP